MSHTGSPCELPYATSGLLLAHRWWGGASHQVPRAGRRPGQALCRPLLVGPTLPVCAVLRAPCVSRACPVCPPPSTVPALSGKEDLPSAPPPQRPALLRNSLGAPGQPGHLLRLWRGGVWGPRTAAPRTLIVGLGEHRFPAKRGRCLRTCRHRGLSPAGPRPVLPSCPPCALRSRAAFPPRYAARTPF